MLHGDTHDVVRKHNPVTTNTRIVVDDADTSGHTAWPPSDRQRFAVAEEADDIFRRNACVVQTAELVVFTCCAQQPKHNPVTGRTYRANVLLALLHVRRSCVSNVQTEEEETSVTAPTRRRSNADNTASLRNVIISSLFEAKKLKTG